MGNNGSNSASSRNIVIAERDNIAAVVDDGKVVEFFIHRGDMLLGDVYLASVENILPSIDAAFVNLGADRMGFLHASDVPGKGDLKERLEPKQKVLVQIMKEPTGHKGPRVSTALSIPGRFVVLMPEEKSISISRKILSPKERSRLKSIVSLIKPPGVGVIIRTEAENQSEEELREDLEICLEKWHNIVTTADTVSPPALIHRDQDLLYRVIREACTENVKEIFIDTPFGHHRVNQLIQTWNLGKDIKVNVYKGPDSLIVSKSLDKEIKAALQSKVNLPSGGYLYIQPTEALTVIDVNSGKFTSSQTQSETIRQTNLEAVDEIARQLRLRNIGGMIVIDFIDMDNRVDQLAVLEAFEMSLQPDKAKPQVGQLSDLGLVELTRHRQGQSLAEIFTKKCPACGGSGHVIEDLTFAPASLESDLRARTSKSKPVPRIKPAVSSAKTEINQAQKALKVRPPKTDLTTSPTIASAVSKVKGTPAPGFSKFRYNKPGDQQTEHRPDLLKAPQRRDQPSAITPAAPAVPEPVVAIEQPVITPSVTDYEPIYFKANISENVDQLTYEKMRKVSEYKKFYPEISKVIRFAGVPLRYAHHNFDEDVNMVDVFTILDEMEAAFARAAANVPRAPQVHRVVHHVEDIPSPEKLHADDIKEAEEFKGRYGISTEGENFEELYEVIDEEENAVEPEQDVKQQKVVVDEEIIDTPDESEHDTDNIDESDETDDDESVDDESDDDESDETEESSQNDPKKPPIKRGRKSKATSVRKRGRPKSK
ncbi:MAG: Rne/Rng family ribonuclease [Cyanobacteriota bacterium]